MSNIDCKIAHLGFIQGVINRMGSNSFMIKGWSITLLAAAMALSSKESNPIFIAIPYITILIFWALDSYYLHQERLFRKLYEQVAADLISSDNFTMNTVQVNHLTGSLYSVFKSQTIVAFHAPLFAITVMFTLVLFTTN